MKGDVFPSEILIQKKEELRNKYKKKAFHPILVFLFFVIPINCEWITR